VDGSQVKKPKPSSRLITHTEIMDRPARPLLLFEEGRLDRGGLPLSNGELSHGVVRGI
jgi:hypothetical protein